jgi:arylsulfatase A-like enzyme
MFGNYKHERPGDLRVRIDDDDARTLRRAYYASVSFVDAQVGKVLDELQRLGLAENTIVVIWGDHGWHLGDQTLWGKHSTFERAVHSVLMIRTPGMPSPGRSTRGIVETLDLYPTLADLAGLEPPPGLTGVSLRPMIEDPDHPGKDAAFSYWRDRYTMRTDRYRVVAYESPGDGPQYELFDHETDPNETRNVAAEQSDALDRLLPKLAAERPLWAAEAP